MSWMAALVLFSKTPHNQKSQGYMFEEQESQMSFSVRTLAFSHARSLALSWIPEDMDEHHMVCIVIQTEAGSRSPTGDGNRLRSCLSVSMYVFQGS